MWNSVWCLPIPCIIVNINRVSCTDSVMTTEEKFNAAVNVIRGLPKNGKWESLAVHID